MKVNADDNKILKRLIEKQVHIPCPESVEVGPDIDPERISGNGVTIHAGCKIHGNKTLIMPGVELGYEAPVTLHDCQAGKNVELKGGFFFDSCFHEGVSIGSGAQVREACLLEEQARCGHTVGLKHTILFPYVTLGSLINFCDCMMAGGTDEKDHSEVGSSYVHFNYTPNQDKATASLMGDVSKGVMINQRPIFLGGQGGLAGPVRIAYGNVVAAGSIVRKDILEENNIFMDPAFPSFKIPFIKGQYSNLMRIIDLNTIYISNLIALRRWYLDVRSMFIKDDPMETFLMEGAIDKLDKAVIERVKRLGQVANQMPEAIEIHKKFAQGHIREKALELSRCFSEKWTGVEQVFMAGLDQGGEPAQKEAFLASIENAIREKGKDYLMVIKNLAEKESLVGTAWLQGIVDGITRNIWEILPGSRINK
ncbi:MAG: hypothetical protein GY864_15175 [Desulfobacterales bacterium]|nr:hypothetical protein [Desulfobacterales bacterium]